MVYVVKTGETTGGPGYAPFVFFKRLQIFSLSFGETLPDRTTSCLASFNNIKHLDTVSDLIKQHKRTGNAIENILGDNGLTLYKSTSKRFRASLVKAFKRNPKALLGITKSHLIIHTIKIFDKHGLLSLLIPLTGFSLIVSYLPQWFIWIIFMGSSVCLAFLINREFKPKTYTKRRIEKC